jgi:hypothetical protein
MLGPGQIPRRQFRDPVDGVIGNAPQNRTQIRLGIDPIQLGGSEQAESLRESQAAGVQVRSPLSSRRQD